MKFHWGKKPVVVASKGSVYIRTPLDKPLGGISLMIPEKPWIRVHGMSLEEAAHFVPGKTIRWHSVSHAFRAQLEAGSESLEMNLDEFKGMVF